MSRLRWIIRRKAIARSTIEKEFTIEGEPIIYSIKYDLNDRHETMNFFQRKMHKTMLRAVFPAYVKSKIPVVLRVRFYVSPPSCDPIKATDLQKERKPATRSFELCDYLLAFLEILRGILINSYRQIVEIDAKKYYSDRPRTTFQFMSWEQYVKLQTSDTVHTETKEVCRAKHHSKDLVQSKRSTSEEDQGVSEAQLCRSNAHGSSSCDTAPPNPGNENGEGSKTPPDAPLPAYKKAGRRQPRKAPI